MVFLSQLQPFLSFPVLLHHILQNTCRLFRFVFCFFSFLFFLFFSPVFLFFLSSGLLCYVLVPGTLRSTQLASP